MAMAGCSSARATWIPEDTTRAIPIAEIDLPELAQARTDLTLALKLSLDSARPDQAKAVSAQTLDAFAKIAADPKIAPELRGLTSYNLAVAKYVTGDLKGAAAAADIAQGFVPDAPFIAAFANRVERQLARERVDGYEKLLRESDRSRTAAEVSLIQARTAETQANSALMASRMAEAQANVGNAEARKVADDAMRKLAIATARFDITLDDVKKAQADGDMMLAGILTQALLRAHGNDPEVLSFLEGQIAREFRQAVATKDLGSMHAQLGALAEALRLVQDSVGTVEQAANLARCLCRLETAQAQIGKTQQAIWTDKATALLGEQMPDDVSGQRRYLEAVDTALASIPDQAEIRKELQQRRIQGGERLRVMLTQDLQNRFTALEQRFAGTLKVVDLQGMRIDAAELQAAAIDAVARDGIERGLATKATDLKDRMESALQVAALRQTQDIADADALRILQEVDSNFATILTAVSARQATAEPTGFWSQQGAALSALERKAMRVDGLCSARVQERARETMRKVGELAGKIAILQRTSYNIWAMENVQKARSQFRAGKGWFNDDEAMFKSALKTLIGPIDTALLDPPVMSMYRAMFDKLFSEIDLEDQVDVSQSMVEIPSRPLSVY
jgi:hypothetical protein